MRWSSGRPRRSASAQSSARPSAANSSFATVDRASGNATGPM